MNDTWADIPGYEGLYQASKNGEIRRVTTGEILTPIKHPRGYLQVSLTCGSRKTYKKLLIHRLVLAAFLGENPEAVGNHIDGNKRNNCLQNLEWVTQGVNLEHYRRMRDRKMDLQRIKENQAVPIDF